jgi:hypothetical protein
MATSGLITPLQAAAATYLLQGLGFNANSTFVSDVATYSNGTITSLGGQAAVAAAGRIPATDLFGNISYSNPVFYTGRFGDHVQTANVQSLGADTIPALTQTVPSGIRDAYFSGNAAGNIVYQFDIACNRALGSATSIDLDYFLSIFGQAYGFIILNNRFVNAANNSDTMTFGNCGVTNQQGLVTQGWDKYKQGSALTKAFSNIGTMTDGIRTGRFGTGNAVAKVIIEKGLGKIGNLSAKLTSVQVNIYDLLNTRYDAAITGVLTNFTNSDDLKTIQESIKSTIPNISNLMDYTSISKCAGINNDSAFSTFEDVGADLYKKSNSPTFTTGADVTALIQSIVVPESTIESLSGANGVVLSDSITKDLRSRLITSTTGGNILLDQLVGTVRGQYISDVEAVIDGINQLSNSSYSSQIVTALNDVINTAADAELLGSNVGGFPYTGTAPYYGDVAAASDAYESLLTTIINDPSMTTIVNQINSNYANICLGSGIELASWTKANFFTTSTFHDPKTYLMFAQSLPQYGQDTQSTGANVYLLGTATDDLYGSTIRSTLIEGQNYLNLQNAGILPNGYVS